MTKTKKFLGRFRYPTISITRLSRGELDLRLVDCNRVLNISVSTSWLAREFNRLIREVVAGASKEIELAINSRDYFVALAKRDL